MPPQRGQGQWALGYREPLNPNERLKRDDDGAQRPAADHRHLRHRGFDSIDPADLRGRLRWWGLYTQRGPGIDGGQDGDAGARGARGRVLHAAGPHRRRAADHRQLRTIAEPLDRVRPRHRRRHRPAEHPAALDPDRGRARDLGAARGGRAVDHRGVRRHPAHHPRLPAGRGRRRRGRSTRRRAIARDQATATSATRRSPTCRASSRRRSAAAPTTAPSTRSTTSRSSACVDPDGTSRASTCGSAAGCPPTRCSPSGSARSSRRSRSPRSGPASRRSSATTATGGSRTAPG